MSDEPRPSEGQVLTDNLGSDEVMLMRGKVDRMIFTNLTGDEYDWLLLCELGEMSGNKPLAAAKNVYLRARYGTDGLALRYAVRGEGVRKGIGGNPDAEIPQRPGILSRINPLNQKAHEDEEKWQQYKKEQGI
jgi:hypothetical protein